MFTFNSRYDCYSRRGIAGILWCPDTNRSSVLTAVAKSFFWPYYAAAAALKARESSPAAGRRPPRWRRRWPRPLGWREARFKLGQG